MVILPRPLDACMTFCMVGCIALKASTTQYRLLSTVYFQEPACMHGDCVIACRHAKQLRNGAAGLWCMPNRHGTR